VSRQNSPSASPSVLPRLLLAALVILGALFLWVVRDALLLGFAAILLAIAVHGIADALRKLVAMPKGLSLALGALIILAVVGAAIGLFGAQLAAALNGVLARLPEAWDSAKQTLEANPLGAVLVEEIERLSSARSANGTVRNMVTSAGGLAFPFASGVTTALLVFFAAAFLTTSASAYFHGALLLFPRGIDDNIAKALKASAIALRKWLLGITVDMILIAVAVGLALWLLGVPAFLGLALIAGIAQFVPTVGPLVAAIPGVLLAFTVSPMTALWTTVAYLTISQLEANLVYPIIQKQAASMPPALILLGILALGMLLGPLGVLLATPILIVVSVFVTKLYVQNALGKDAAVPGA